MTTNSWATTGERHSATLIANAPCLRTGAACRIRPERDRVISAQLLSESHNDALGATDVAQPVRVLVLRQLAHEFSSSEA